MNKYRETNLTEEEMKNLNRKNTYIAQKVNEWQSFPYVKPLTCRNPECECSKLRTKITKFKVLLECPKCRGIQYYIPQSVLQTTLAQPAVLLRNKLRNTVKDRDS